MEGMREGFGATSQRGEAFFRRAPLLKLLGCLPETWQVPWPCKGQTHFPPTSTGPGVTQVGPALRQVEGSSQSVSS